MVAVAPFLHFAAAASQGSSSDGTVLAAAIAAAASFVAALIAAGASIYTARKQSSSQQLQYAQRQLYELYGPLKMLRDHSKELRAKIGPPGQDLTNPADWRLVEHIEDVPRGSPQAAMVDSIISINDRISKLLEEKGGLSVQMPPPHSFAQFLAHAELLARSWKAHKNQTEDERTVFPRDLDNSIDDAIRTLRQRLGEKAEAKRKARRRLRKAR
jgi:hypothetical protein